MALGRIGEGWDDYEARLDPQFAGATAFVVETGRAGRPRRRLAGKTLLVMGEQGLGDEVLFANMLPDVLEALGPDGKLMLAVEPRLVPLFQRSFPTAEVGRRTSTYQAARPQPSARRRRWTTSSGFDLWAPMASLLRRFRRRLDDFPGATAVPDRRSGRGSRIGGGAGRRAGRPQGRHPLEEHEGRRRPRSRYFSPFELWAPVLKTPGVTFVNVQYGDCDAEIDWAAREPRRRDLDPARAST